MISIAFLAFTFIPRMFSNQKSQSQSMITNVQETNPVAEPMIVVTTAKDHCSPVLTGEIKSNPTFLNVAQAGCENNPYIGKTVAWTAEVSNYAHTGGIRFWVIDNDHPESGREKHGFFWGTFLAAAKEDPRETDSGLKKWTEKWRDSWINCIMDIYGNIDYDKTKSEKFLVTATVDNVDCSALYDGCYIETTVSRIEEIKI